MCQVISFGFTLNGGGTLNGPTCNGLTTDTIGAQISILTDASDIGQTYVGTVYLLFNGSPTGSYIYNSAPKYMGGLTMWTFDISFTDIVPKIGTYSLLDGCVYINTSDGLSQACFSCTTTKCTSLTTTTPLCTQPSCSFNIV